MRLTRIEQNGSEARSGCVGLDDGKPRVTNGGILVVSRDIKKTARHRRVVHYGWVASPPNKLRGLLVLVRLCVSPRFRGSRSDDVQDEIELRELPRLPRRGGGETTLSDQREPCSDKRALISS